MDFDAVCDIVDDIECEPFKLAVTRTAGVTDLYLPPRGGNLEAMAYERMELEELVFIQAWLERKDTVSGEVGWGHGTLYFIDPYATVDDVVKRCFVACRDYAEHEVREEFTYCGARVLGPHVSLEIIREAL